MKIIENLQLNKNHFLLQYRVDGKHLCRFHAHQGMEFIYIYRGTGFFMLDHRLFELRNGTLIYFQPFQLHRICQDNSLEYIRSYAVFEPSVFEPYLPAFPVLRSFFLHLWKDQLQNQVFYDLEENHPLVLLFRELLHKTQCSPAHQMSEEYAFLCCSGSVPFGRNLIKRKA